MCTIKQIIRSLHKMYTAFAIEQNEQCCFNNIVKRNEYDIWLQYEYWWKKLFMNLETVWVHLKYFSCYYEGY